MWTIIAVAITVLLVSYYYLKDNDFFEKRGIPYEKPFPFLGSMLKIMLLRKPFAELLCEIYNINRDAKYVGFFDFSAPIITLRDLELIRTITIKNFDNFPNHMQTEAKGNDVLFSKNLFNLRDERWKEVRALLSPAFTSSKMKSMFILIKECAERYGKYLASLPAEQTILELKDLFSRYTNDVIATCAFGENVDSVRDPENQFYKHGREGITFGRWKTFKFFLVRNFPTLCSMLGISIFSREIYEFFTGLVSDVIKNRDEKGIVRPDMIQLMMETRNKMGPDKLTIEDMTAQAFIFFLGGFENTSILMCFAAYEVGVNEEIQKRLQEEIDQVLEDCNGVVTYEAINRMKYLDAVVNETLRKYPAVMHGDRVCSKPFELPPTLPTAKPHVIQKGQSIFIPIYPIHHDPDIYPEPDKFKPERFYDDPKQILNSGAFLSFGQGPRMCIANRFAVLEIKTLLFHVFANCDLKPCAKTLIPMKLTRKVFSLVSEDGYWFDVQPRNKSQHVLVNSVTGNSVIG